ncbi:MAG TPA: carboxylate-amine ligase [Ktedonobacteraceae bacterium]|jgi:carboxylate-amine ligase|nr:carboxylate-amine ligase [Ktedonobacteraceae bacterium]
MSKRFTLGIEEEFQLVDTQTGELSSRAPLILEKGAAIFGENIKPEMLQSTIELISDVLPDIHVARRDLYAARAQLVKCVDKEGLALISAGTHPSSDWQDQLSSEGERYQELAREYQDVVLSDLIFGLHVHVGVGDDALMIKVLNQVRTWLPHLLALSSNSPFWVGRLTGLKSYRSVQWKRFPRSGVPPIIASYAAFENHVQQLVDMGAIDDGKKVWWDVRPHAYFKTIEFRIFDMPLTIDDTLALAALCQALVAKLVALVEDGKQVPIIESTFIEENKWWALLYGLDATIYDFERKKRVPMREAIRSLLDFVHDQAEEFGSLHEIQHLYNLLGNAEGTGADRQIAIYRATGDTAQVIRYLREQTLAGIELSRVAT